MKAVEEIMWRFAVLGTLLLPAVGGSAAPVDKTDSELRRCLDAPGNASTAAQVECEVVARDAYDRRMNAAYASILRILHQDAAERLREAQRAWIRFRDTNDQANAALFATRQGTMYVAMQAAGQTAVIRDRAIALETQLRVLKIDD